MCPVREVRLKPFEASECIASGPPSGQRILPKPHPASPWPNATSHVGASRAASVLRVLQAWRPASTKQMWADCCTSFCHAAAMDYGKFKEKLLLKVNGFLRRVHPARLSAQSTYEVLQQIQLRTQLFCFPATQGQRAGRNQSNR